MTTQNIAIVMAPNLLWTRLEEGFNMTATGTHSLVVDSLLQHCDWFFPEGGRGAGETRRGQGAGPGEPMRGQGVTGRVTVVLSVCRPVQDWAGLVFWVWCCDVLGWSRNDCRCRCVKYE